MADSTDKVKEPSSETASNCSAAKADSCSDKISASPPNSAKAQAEKSETELADITTTFNDGNNITFPIPVGDGESPMDELPTSPMSSTATFAGANAIQPRPRLQRSSIPPPIDTEDASKDADTSLRSKLLSNLSPAVLDAAGQQIQKQMSAPDTLENVASLAQEVASDAPVKTDTDIPSCAHIGVSSSKNRRYRRTMEDAHFYNYDFDDVKGQCLMAIFDGHAGKQAAQWCSENFASIFLELKHKTPNLPIPDLFNKVFVEADRRLADDVKTSSGCTAVVAFLQVQEIATDSGIEHKRTLFCANVGDARAVVSRGGTAARLTYDHKGDDAHEVERIFESGGYVFNGRVNGVLAVTRALGDSSLKQYVVGNPYTTEMGLNSEDDLLVLACDGLWDVCSDQEAIDLVRDTQDPLQASQTLLNYALSNESTDNITTMVFRLPALS